MEFLKRTYESIIIIAGGSPDCVSLLKEFAKNRENKLIMCADGGIDFLNSLNIIPDVLVGDLDSAKKYNNSYEIIKLNPVKDETDLEYIINLIVDNSLTKSVHIFSALGKRMDHTMANIFTLKRFSDNDIFAVIYDSYNKIQVFNGEITLSADGYKYLSIIPMTDNNCIYASGVKYPLNGECLNPFTSRGISNEIIVENAVVKSNVPTIIIQSDDNIKK